MGTNKIELPGIQTAAERRDRMAVEVYRFVKRADANGMGRLAAIAQIRQIYHIYSTYTIYNYMRRGAELLGEKITDGRSNRVRK